MIRSHVFYPIEIQRQNILSYCATERRNLAVDEGLSPPRWDSLTHQEPWLALASHIQVSFLWPFATRDSNAFRLSSINHALHRSYPHYFDNKTLPFSPIYYTSEIFKGRGVPYRIPLEPSDFYRCDILFQIYAFKIFGMISLYYALKYSKKESGCGSTYEGKVIKVFSSFQFPVFSMRRVLFTLLVLCYPLLASLRWGRTRL